MQVMAFTQIAGWTFRKNLAAFGNRNLGWPERAGHPKGLSLIFFTLAKQTKAQALGLGPAAILARQAERAAQRVEQTVVADSSVCLPVFFRGRK
jgi:hypothetical protein